MVKHRNHDISQGQNRKKQSLNKCKHYNKKNEHLISHPNVVALKSISIENMKTYQTRIR